MRSGVRIVSLKFYFSFLISKASMKVSWNRPERLKPYVGYGMKMPVTDTMSPGEHLLVISPFATIFSMRGT